MPESSSKRLSAPPTVAPNGTNSGRRAWLWAMLLLVAAVVNLLQFRSIQASAELRFRAFATWRSHISKYVPVLRYDMPVALARVAPGATLILPKRGEWPTREFKGQATVWGDLKGIRYLDYDPETFLKDLNIKKSVLAKTSTKLRPRRYRKPFVLIGEKLNVKRKRGKTSARKRKNREFILIKRGETHVMVDTALVARKMKKLGRGR